MNLSNAGFTNNDVREIRFFCNEKFNGDKNYWHFKSNNDEIIQVAMTGNQEYLRAESLAQGYTELSPPFEWNGIYKKRAFKSMIESTDYVGTNQKGGFTLTPFGMSRYNIYWTIKGSSEAYPRFECGTKHDYLSGFTNSELSPMMVESHHTIWFRGKAPEKEAVQNRLLGRIVK